MNCWLSSPVSVSAFQYQIFSRIETASGVKDKKQQVSHSTHFPHPPFAFWPFFLLWLELLFWKLTWNCVRCVERCSIALHRALLCRHGRQVCLLSRKLALLSCCSKLLAPELSYSKFYILLHPWALVCLQTHLRTFQTGTAVYLHSCTTQKQICQWSLEHHAVGRGMNPPSPSSRLGGSFPFPQH